MEDGEKFDFSDLFETGVGFLIKQLLLFALAVWTGSFIGGISLVAGRFAGPSVPDLSKIAAWILGSPVLLMSPWGFFNAVFLGITGCRLFIYSESTSMRTWAVLVGVEGFFAMAPVTERYWEEWLSLGVAWGVWAILTAMMGTGFWFFNSWRMSRWNAELIGIEADNVVRRAELKEELAQEAGGSVRD